MIEEIISFTKISKDELSLFDFNNDLSMLNDLNYYSHIENRQSFRLFDPKINLSTEQDLIGIFNLLDNIVNSIFKLPEIIDLCIVDNKGNLHKNQKDIYIYKENNFKKIITQKTWNKENFYIQEEMHDADGVIFFLWDFSKIPKEYREYGRFYKEIIMLSGFLGQVVAEYAEKANWKGTPFAGIIESDWDSIVNRAYSSNKKPIFAYSFQKNY